MSTDVRIECIVLDGLELSHRDRSALGPAIARELRRLVGEPAGERPGRPGETGPDGPGAAVHGIAREVAAAVYLATAAARPAGLPAAAVRPPALRAHRRGRR